MAGIILCDTTPEVTEMAGLFVIETESGGERIALALTQRAISILAYRATEAVNALAEKRRAVVVALPTAKPARARKVAAKAPSAAGEA